MVALNTSPGRCFRRSQGYLDVETDLSPVMLYRRENACQAAVKAVALKAQACAGFTPAAAGRRPGFGEAFHSVVH